MRRALRWLVKVTCRHPYVYVKAATGAHYDGPPPLASGVGRNVHLGVVVTCEVCRRQWAHDVTACAPHEGRYWPKGITQARKGRKGTSWVEAEEDGRRIFPATDTRERDVHLIAAAPELLAACISALHHFTSPDAVDDEGNYDPAEISRTILKLNTAIDKARGGQ